MRDPSVAPGNLQPGAKTTSVFFFFPLPFSYRHVYGFKSCGGEGGARRALIAI